MLGWLSTISFAAPWALTALLLLPVLWQLLRVTPPKPTQIRFPAVRLLQELGNSQQLATKTPWWVLLLRSLIILCLILSLAQPVMDRLPQQDDSETPLVLIIDNDWSVMDRWGQRRDEIDKIMDQAILQNRLVLTLASADDVARDFQAPRDAAARLATLKAQPWAGDRQAVLERLETALKDQNQIAKILWISNGLKSPQIDFDFASQLHQMGDLEVISETAPTDVHVIKALKRTQEGFDIEILSAKSAMDAPLTLQVLDEQSGVLLQKDIEGSGAATVTLPVELRNRAATLRLNNQINPAAQYLLDEKWRDRPVGILDQATSERNLLDPAYYIEKSLKPYAPLIKGPLDELLSRPLSLIFHSGKTSLSDDDVADLLNWINQGGIFIQFANEALSHNQNDTYNAILPVELLGSERLIGGTLSWKRSAKLAPFTPDSPFHGVALSEDINIKKQILARPHTDLADKTWARLEDGTPLITAEKKGEGWSILVHVTSVPGWSNLPLSGTFEVMMTRLLNLSSGNDLQAFDQPLPPYRLFNHNGNLVTPYSEVAPLVTKNIKGLKSSSSQPPGFYGQEKALYAFNLGPSIERLEALDELPLGAEQRGFQDHQERILAPWLLAITLLLALIDWLLSLTWLRRGTIAAMITLLLSLPQVAQGETNWDKALVAANDMRLAYMVTGNAKVDEATRRGLDGLASVLRRRTAVELGPAMAYDPEKDDPSLFPLIYWPIVDATQMISDDASDRLNRFLNTGGFLLIDTLGHKQSRKLARLNEKIDINALQLIPKNHVLTRSFYLMDEFPGRYNLGDIWVEAAQDSMRDGVSGVLIGANGWAEAWARDDTLRPLYPVIPGDEIQREQAYRFGINLVMYVLSGNYKGDQVHLPAILQRLGL